jgi:DMSO/TMAO reductase YedYZ molybdopterin-dependent catalytic subunit
LEDAVEAGRIACNVALVVMTTIIGLGAQTDATIVVSGDVAKPLTISAADLKTMARTTVVLPERDGVVKYSGVLVAEILARAGTPLGRDLSGPALTTYVLATAKDGYQVVFSLAELDPAFSSSDVIVADAANGEPLADNRGPFRLIAPHDKRAARAVRMLQRLEVVRLRK